MSNRMLYVSVLLVLGGSMVTLAGEKEKLTTRANSTKEVKPIGLGTETPRDSRRVVYVSDPSNTTWLISDPAKPEELRQWISNVAAGGVDTYVQEVFSECWSLFYRTDLCEFDTRDQHKRFIPMMDAGTMPLEIYIDESHKLGMEFVAGFRMADRHGHNKAFWPQHKDWALKDFGYGIDYSVPEARDWVFSIMEEVANRFDVDGVELNFIRWMHCFPRATAQQQHPVMTGFVRRLRKMLDSAGEKKGRRLLLGVRVPQTLEECHRLGYDVPSWIKEGLIDYVSPCDFFFPDFNAKYEEFAELTRASDCYLYPTIQPLVCHGDDFHRLTLDQYRAVVQNFYGAGADGLSVHNYPYHWGHRHYKASIRKFYPAPADNYPKTLEYFRVLKDPQALAEGARHYLFYPLWPRPSPSDAVKNDRAALKRSQPGQRVAYRFRLCERLPESVELEINSGALYNGSYNKAGKIHGVSLIFRAIGLVPGDEISVDVNGQEIVAENIRHIWHQDGRPGWDGRSLPPYTEFQFMLAAPPGIYGDNHLGLKIVKNADGAEGDIVVDEVEVIVQPKNLP